MIDKTTIIEDGAVIADDVVIGPFCYIGSDVIILTGCKLESNVILKGYTEILQDVHIFSFTTIGDKESKITIEQNTTIREFVQIGTDCNTPAKEIIIGHHTFIMAYVQIANGVVLGHNCIITNAVRLYKNVICSNFVIIGGLSTIESNIKIGESVMIGGASCVTHDIPPFCLVEGNKSSIKGLNLIGLRRRVEDVEIIDEIKIAYKQLLATKVNKRLAKEITNQSTNTYVRQFANFIEQSNL